jgi:hypothetical protein
MSFFVRFGGAFFNARSPRREVAKNGDAFCFVAVILEMLMNGTANEKFEDLPNPKTATTENSNGSVIRNGVPLLPSRGEIVTL